MATKKREKKKLGRGAKRRRRWMILWILQRKVETRNYGEEKEV